MSVRAVSLLTLLPFAAAFGCGARSALEVSEGAPSASPATSTSSPAPAASTAPRGLAGFDAVFWGEAGAFGLRLGSKLESLQARAAYAWSPDHTQVAVAGGEDPVSEIVSIGGVRKPCDADVAPSWSPDSKRLAFGRHGMPFIANADCSNPKSPSVSPKVSPIGPFITWSSNSRYAAFQYFLGSSNGLNVHVVDAQALTTAETYGLTDALWSTVFFSPDASHVAMAQPRGYVQFMPPAGPPSFAVEVDAGDGFGSWSFDSSRFAIGSTVIAADGTGYVSLESTSTPNNSRKWSPTELTLAYCTANGVALWPSGGMLGLPGAQTTDLRWAPDGRHLAYQSTDSASPGSWASVVVDPKSGVELLRIPSANNNLAELAWNSSGSRLVANANSRELYSANSDGSNAHVIAKNVSSFVWLPDGSHLAYSDETSVFTIRSDGSELKIVRKMDSYVNFLPL